MKLGILISILLLIGCGAPQGDASGDSGSEQEVLVSESQENTGENSDTQRDEGLYYAKLSCSQLIKIDNLKNSEATYSDLPSYRQIVSDAEKAYNENPDYKAVLDTAVILKDLDNYIGVAYSLEIVDRDIPLFIAAMALEKLEGTSAPVSFADLKDSLRYTRCENILSQE